ncbi:unnamed protein product [Clonostachys rhizophaga]|uniref:Uncharacterized protein n=1 Tax=Clonostachys rhizophaga TaxID=160324 RepID=A0A9N9YRU2_9HYPO|nr:unnamed protein product [Clonostachys rhizophaga]
MRFNILKAGIAALLAATLPGEALASSSTFATRRSTTTLFIPPANTGNVAIWASPMTSSSSTTRYLLGCQNNWVTPQRCNGDFKGVILTQAPNEVHVAIAGTTYDCTFNSNNAVCATKTAASAQASNTTVTETAKWMTGVTIVDTRVKVCSTTKRKNKPSATSCSERAAYVNVAGYGDSAASPSQFVGTAAVGMVLAAYLGVALLL